MGETEKGGTDDPEPTEASGPEAVEKAEFRRIVKDFPLLFELLR